MLTYLTCALLASQTLAINIRSETGMSIQANGKVMEFNANNAELNTALDTAQTVLAEVEDWARSGSPPEGRNIKTIDDLAKKLEDALYATHKDAQAQVDENIARIEKCNTEQDDSMRHITATTKVQVGKHREEHAKCRNEEVDIFEDMEKKCNHLTAWLKETVQGTPKQEGSSDDEMVEYVGQMDSYWCPKGKVAREKQTVCEKRKRDHSKKKEACDKFQAIFETGFCSWRTKLIDVCNTHETCYDEAKNAYDAHVKSTKVLVQKWKIEYTALKKIICYVNVWFEKDDHATVAGGEDTDVERKRLDECKSLKPDDSKMDIRFGEAPEKKECSLQDVKEYPGTAGFKKIEYSKWLEFINEPSSCLEEPEPTQAPETTKAPTTTTTTKAVCYAEVYQHSGFKGWKATFAEGDHDYEEFVKTAAQNDHASAIKVFGKGCQAVLYQHARFKGTKATFTTGSYDYSVFHKRFPNDQLSSLKVQHTR